MIGFLKGRVLSKQPDSHTITLLESGVGYEVQLHANYFEHVLQDMELALWVHTHVREDILQLYGFASEQEKSLFRILLSVSGLGPRTAMNLLSQHGPGALTQAIITKDLARISEASGVGKKLAERIVLELASKLQKFQWIQDLQTKTSATKPLPAEQTLRDDLHSALLNLGYPIQQVRPVIDRLMEQNLEASFENCLKMALGEMSGHMKVTHGTDTLNR